MSPLADASTRISQLTSGVQHAAAVVLPLVERWGLLLIAIMVFSEFVAGLGYFAQADLTMIAAGMVYGGSAWMVVACILTAVLAAVAGSLLSRRLGRAGRTLAGQRMNRPSLKKAAAAVRKHDGFLAFAFHFSGWLRPSVPLLAGTSGVDERDWLPWDAAGAAAWVSLLFVLGVHVKGMLYRTLRASDVVVLLVLLSVFGGVALLARRTVSRSVGDSTE